MTVPLIELVLFRDDDLVNDDDDANFTDLLSSTVLPAPTLILDGRRDRFDSSTFVTSFTNSSTKIKFSFYNQILSREPSEIRPLSFNVEINDGGMISSLFKHLRYKARS